MRFVCDSCRAQYMISDDKVGPKGVKVRCKKCGHTITVRPAGAQAGKDSAPEPASTPPPTPAINGVGKEAEPAATLPASLGTPPEGGLFTDVEEDEIGAVFDQVLSAGTQKLPTGQSSAEAAARDASTEAVRRLAEAEAEPSKEEAKPASAHEWYVAIDDKQIGPLTVEKVKDYWDKGEVGAESLCWRSGFSDWIPLSETPELASVLAPRPSSKPVIVAPESMSGSSATMSSGPVQSAFSAGKASRGDSAPAPSSSEAPVGWKPSAASVLASLVKEENEALSKPPPTPAPALGKEPVSQSRLLDVPMPPPEPVSSPSLPGMAAPAMAAPLQQPMAPMPYPQQPVTPYGQPVPAPYAQQPVTPYGQPVPAPYPPPGYAPAYPPPGAAPAGGKGKMGLLVGVAAGLLVVAGGAVVSFMGGNRTDTPTAPPAVAQQASAQPGTSLPPMPPPPAGMAQAAAPATAAPAASPAPVVAAAPAAAPDSAAAAPANPPAAAAAPAVAAAPTATPSPAPAAPAAETPKVPDSAVAKVERTQPKRTGSGSSAAPRPEPETRPAPKVVERQPAGEVESDDFDELFGTKKQPKAEPKQEPKPVAYVPPEPGGGVPEKLQQSDIMAVVLANKPAIVKCVNEQKKKDPALSGKLVMRWSIQPSGKTTSVSCRTDEFRSTYMASCISGLIKGWNFPRHKKQGDPIDFPFTF
jgi:predicted Zn finger-like uncharacterized protein